MSTTDWGMGDETPSHSADAPVLSLEQVRSEMEKAGITATEWAKANGFCSWAVTDVLLGRRAGHRGEAHRIAVALGLKAGQVVSAKGWKPTTAASATA